MSLESLRTVGREEAAPWWVLEGKLPRFQEGPCLGVECVCPFLLDAPACRQWSDPAQLPQPHPRPHSAQGSPAPHLCAQSRTPAHPPSSAGALEPTACHSGTVFSYGAGEFTYLPRPQQLESFMPPVVPNQGGQLVSVYLRLGLFENGRSPNLGTRVPPSARTGEREHASPGQHPACRRGTRGGHAGTLGDMRGTRRGHRGRVGDAWGTRFLPAHHPHAAVPRKAPTWPGCVFTSV